MENWLHKYEDLVGIKILINISLVNKKYKRIFFLGIFGTVRFVINYLPALYSPKLWTNSCRIFD